MLRPMARKAAILLRKSGDTYILNTFGKPVVADVAFALVPLRAVEPRDAFVDEPAQDFCPHKVCDRRPPSGGHIRHTCGVAQQPSDQIERREDGCGSPFAVIRYGTSAFPQDEYGYLRC